MNLRCRLRLLIQLLGGSLIALLGRTSQAGPAAISDAINELALERAQQLLAEQTEPSAELSFLRARLAVYQGDCDSAEAILEPLRGMPQALDLLDLARNCARAVAGAKIVADESAGVWVRLQDDEDGALVPYMVRVVDKAREASERALGVRLPRPLRIELVRDLFSLSAVSGLPLSAAETTGTVAVARWARITMLSPRASRFGFPWEDTLAHEIAHLVLSAASRDYAPLWLQEGIAKRQEASWRKARPFDKTPTPQAIARQALLSGNSVGVTNLGKSIALLPTPEHASIAYAEVESFVDFWIAENGEPAFHLLLRDLKGLGQRDPDSAMRSVSGYGLNDWILRWQAALRAPAANDAGNAGEPRSSHGRGVLRQVRLGDLAFDRRAFDVSSKQYQSALLESQGDAVIKYRAARAHLALGALQEAERTLGELDGLAGLHARWLALSGYIDRQRAEHGRAERTFSTALALDPYAVEVACEGYDPKWGASADEGRPPFELPLSPEKKELCSASLRIPRE